MSVHNFIDLIGQVFSRLTVIKKVGSNKWNEVQWLCKCICGNETIVSGSNLRSENTKSCGCLLKEAVSLSYGEAAFKILYKNYKNNAIKRGIIWNLTIEQFRMLIDGNCFYCNIKPNQICKNKNGNGDYIYNGIDRIDNNLGYTIDNCVTCCKICNYWKKAMTQQEFLEHAKKIVNQVKFNLPIIDGVYNE